MKTDNTESHTICQADLSRTALDIFVAQDYLRQRFSRAAGVLREYPPRGFSPSGAGVRGRALDLDEQAARVENPRWNKERTAFTAPCPVCKTGTLAVSSAKTKCLKKCTDPEIAAWFANGARKKPKESVDDRSNEGAAAGPAEQSKIKPPPKQEKSRFESQSGPRASSDRDRTHDILKRTPPNNLEAEQSVLGAILLDNQAIEEAIRILKTTDFYRESHRLIFDAMLTISQKLHAPIDPVTLGQELTSRHHFEQTGGQAYIAELAAFVPTAQNIASYARIVRDMAVKREIASKATWLASLAYDGVSVDALMGEVERSLKPTVATEVSQIIAFEDYEAAAVANEEYLRRTPVIDKLCYSSAVSMITGGKHAGKSTLARWMAICVSKGYDFLKRTVQQGPVLYIASDDETMAARQELIRLGWTRGDNLRFLSASSVKIEDERAFLVRLTSEITRMHAVLVIVDMLFDFIPVQDEMSYAGTREAVGLMQAVATGSGSHIVAIHHAPKNANIGDAAVAALGSQGLAARVSPIILVRRFGLGVHSISSTSVRDPRGEPLLESKLIRNEDGSVELGGGWKNYMLAEVYVGRVKEMLDEDPGAELTAPEISEALTISYEVARSCLATMYRNGLIVRTGSGKKGKPYRYSSPISAANAQPDDAKYPTSTGQGGYSESNENNQNQAVQQPFAYKD